MGKTVIQHNNSEIDCYGDMHPGQNIEVVCNDEFDDGFVAEGFDSWELAVRALTDSGRFPSGIVQLEAI